MSSDTILQEQAAEHCRLDRVVVRGHSQRAGDGRLSVQRRDTAAQHLVRQIRRRYCNCGRKPLHRVEVSCVDHVVYLRGVVPSYFLKQTAQELAKSAVGLRQLVNLISVEPG